MLLTELLHRRVASCAEAMRVSQGRMGQRGGLTELQRAWSEQSELAVLSVELQAESRCRSSSWPKLKARPPLGALLDSRHISDRLPRHWISYTQQLE